VVDDEPSILNSISDLLETEFDVLTSTDARLALEKLAAEEISTLISDQRMPDLNGDQFLQFAKERSSASRILLTGFADIEALARAVNEGRIYAYVTKPWDPLALRTIVRSAVKEYCLSSALRYERDLLRTLVDNIPDCVYVQDANQRYTLVNESFARLAGMGSSIAAVGKTEEECLPGEFGRTAAVDGRRVLETGQPITAKCDEWRQDGRPARWYSSTRVPVRGPSDGRIEGLVGISIDVTKHKEIEQYLKTSKETAEATVRAKQEFLALTSHELRTPLNSILGMTDLLSGTELSEQQRTFINVCRTNGEVLMRLLSDLSDLSRSDCCELKLTIAELNLAQLVESVIESNRERAATSGIKLMSDFRGDIPGRLMGDESRLKQILANLVNNAIKFTRQGYVLVTVNCLSVENGKALLEVTVADTGIGIAPNKLNVIFEPFSQAEDFITRKYGGTGLGLTISRRLVAQMGGAISVESSLGVGSVFRFKVGLNVARITRMSDGISHRHQAYGEALAGLRILLAEDNEDSVFLMKEYLRSARVETAWNGREAVDQFMGGEFDIVLMDHQMPEMDGLEATRRIRQWEKLNHRLATPILACTAHATARDSLNAGCTGYLAKPILRQTLLDAIANHVANPKGI
jgi:PAS domain S-box-containing protein